MKEIKGYVFIPHFIHRNFRPLFGPLGENEIPQENESRSYSNIITNELTLFSSSQETKVSAQEYFTYFTPEKISKIECARIEMMVADSFNEFSYFEDKNNLIMITNPTRDFKQHGLYGPITNIACAHGVLPYQNLYLNGFTAFNIQNSSGKNGLNHYERALYAVREANRQGQLPATIAQFSIKIFKKKII